MNFLGCALAEEQGKAAAKKSKKQKTKLTETYCKILMSFVFCVVNAIP